MPYGLIKMVKAGLYDGLQPDGTKPLPKPILTIHHTGFVALTTDPIYSEIS